MTFWQYWLGRVSLKVSHSSSRKFVICTMNQEGFLRICMANSDLRAVNQLYTVATQVDLLAKYLYCCTPYVQGRGAWSLRRKGSGYARLMYSYSSVHYIRVVDQNSYSLLINGLHKFTQLNAFMILLAQWCVFGSAVS